MKLSTNRVVGIIAVVLAIIAAVVLGQMRKEHFLSKEPTDLLAVEYRQWICDEAALMDKSTEQTVEQYNAAWDEKYYAVVAVATLERLNGWDSEDYAAALGKEWGLGENDMILVLVANGDWQVYMGDYVGSVMQDYQQQKLRQALDEYYYDGDFDGAVTAFFRQADVFYAQVNPAQKMTGYSDYGWYAPVEHGKQAGGGIGGVIVLVLLIFLVWVLLDRVRYNRYRRRYVRPGIIAPVVYYPIFWGRSLYRPAPPRPAAPPPPAGGGYRPRPAQSRPVQSTRPSSGGFNGGGFRGGRRSSGGSFGGRSSRGGFGGGGFRGGRR